MRLSPQPGERIERSQTIRFNFGDDEIEAFAASTKVLDATGRAWNGLIDAAENNIPSYDTAKHVEAVKVYSKTEHSMAPEMLLMSKKVFDALPPQAPLSEAGRAEAGRPTGATRPLARPTTRRSTTEKHARQPIRTAKKSPTAARKR